MPHVAPGTELEGHVEAWQGSAAHPVLTRRVPPTTETLQRLTHKHQKGRVRLLACGSIDENP